MMSERPSVDQANAAATAELNGQASATAPKLYALPDGVYETRDERGQWTDVQGAMVLAGKSRRTIFHWIAKQWIVVKRTPSHKPLILVASLFASEEAGGGS